MRPVAPCVQAYHPASYRLPLQKRLGRANCCRAGRACKRELFGFLLPALHIAVRNVNGRNDALVARYDQAGVRVVLVLVWACDVEVFNHRLGPCS